MAPLVSVLIPSRGRPGLLKESIESLGEGNYEVSVAVDNDDPSLLEYDPNQVTEVTDRFGYAYLHEYYNLLAAKARGDWLLLWNDDAEMKGDWLDKITADPDQPWVATFGEEKCFPLISRKLYEIIGHFSKGPANDTYLLGVGDRAGIRIKFDPVKIHHKRDYVHDGTETDKNGTLKEMELIMASKEILGHEDKDAGKVLRWKQSPS